MPLKNVIWIKLWLCLLDNDDFMDSLTDAEKWYFVGMLLLYPKHGYRLKDDKKFLSKKLTQTGQDITQSVDNIVRVMGLRRRKGNIYIPNFKKYNPYIWKGKGIPTGTIKEFPDKIREDKIRKEIYKERKHDYNYKTFKEAHNPEFMDFLKEAYPDVHVGFEFKRMGTWLETNPNKRYKNYGKFCRNWIDRAGKGFQDQPPEPSYIQHVYSKEEEAQMEKDKLQAQAFLAEKVKKLAEEKKL